MIEKSTTLKDIARIAGVSTAAVSMALNNRPGVGPAKRHEIIDIAQKNGYRPNMAAKALVSKHSYALGLVINNISDPFFTELAAGVEKTARSLGYHIILCSIDGRADDRKQYLDLMRSRGVDGLVISTAAVRDPHIGSLIAAGVPFVCINRVPLEAGISEKIDTVTLDNHAAGYQGIAHLWRLGHDRIAVISGDLNASNALATLDGSKNAMADYGIAATPTLLKNGRYSRRIAQQKANQLMRLKRPPSAIFAHDDNMALGVREALLGLNLRIPEDVALMGMDDIQMGALTGVELTTVSPKKSEMGAMGVRILVNRIEAGTPRMVERVVLNADLIVRKTCGYANGGYKR